MDREGRAEAPERWGPIGDRAVVPALVRRLTAESTEDDGRMGDTLRIRLDEIHEFE